MALTRTGASSVANVRTIEVTAPSTLVTVVDPGYGRSFARPPNSIAVLNRLCGLADLARPEVVLSDQRQPNSWVVHLPGHCPRLYLTRGLRALLTRDELAAVLFHELAHIANRDALVMTVVGGPGTVLPTKDLRTAVAMNAFNLVAVPDRGRSSHRNWLFARVTATHPPLRARLDAIHRLERAQHSRHV